MPNFKEHYKYAKYTSIITGIISTAITQNIAIGLTSTFNTIFSSLYPDSDIKSHSQKFIVISLILINLIAIIMNPLHILNITVFSISCFLILVGLLTKHRSITHNFIFGLVLQALILIAINSMFPLILLQNIAIMASGYIGFSLHILLDTFKKD